ncbi:MAG: SUMF1/EgtB/PvdO family nonheme iron enzyme [Bacteroidetes bacterium]|nr:SUMF1/EgtB/PvdO family nonheme iron enzyme [Bacteroidota bacterium]
MIKINKKNISRLSKFSILLLLLSACSSKSEQSSTTGWDYNNPDNGGFEVSEFQDQATGPGLVFIEGGTFVMGRTEQDVMTDWNNVPRRVTVSSFYMDETEIRNLDYLEYLYWLGRVYGTDFPETVKKAQPDQLVWRNELSYNEDISEFYLHHPAYRDYPVVGVNWIQANDYCAWRTDRVNEDILIQMGILEVNPDQTNDNSFNTDAYLAGQYEGLVREDLEDLNPSGSGTRKVRMEDNILLPKYRLPTEAEWEYAALGLIGNTMYERVIERRIYPWNGHLTRTDDKNAYGEMVANYKRGRGDYMGVAGNLNDAADHTAPVYAFWPNDYGLYNMAGNVSEWVLDVYRPLSHDDMTDLNPFRGNVYKKKSIDSDGMVKEKDSLGRIVYENVTVEENVNRRNYRKANNINYLDGDYSTVLANDWLTEQGNENTTKLMYEYAVSSMVNDEARVYKGGSWKDKAYYLSPGTRRFLDEKQSTDNIGFRCAMTRVGAPFQGK